MIFCYEKDDVIKEVLGGPIPRENEHITFDGKSEFLVDMVLYDYDAKKVYVKVRKIHSSNYVTFLAGV